MGHNFQQEPAVSNQPDQSQPYTGAPPGHTPPGYIAPPVPPQYLAPETYLATDPQPQYSQYQYGGQHYGATASAGQQFAPPSYYQSSPGFAQVTSGPRGLSLASMIIGLTSLLFVGGLVIPQIVGIILGHMGMRKENPQGRAFSLAGLITNYLALLIWGVIWAFYIFFFAVLMASIGSEYTSTT